jgi:hypothetical protein
VSLHEIEVTAAELRSRRGMANILSRGELPGIVEQPRYRRVAIAIAPEDVVTPVPVDVAGAKNVEACSGGAHVLRASS